MDGKRREQTWICYIGEGFGRCENDGEEWEWEWDEPVRSKEIWEMVITRGRYSRTNANKLRRVKLDTSHNQAQVDQSAKLELLSPGTLRLNSLNDSIPSALQRIGQIASTTTLSENGNKQSPPLCKQKSKIYPTCFLLCFYDPRNIQFESILSPFVPNTTHRATQGLQKAAVKEDWLSTASRHLIGILS